MTTERERSTAGLVADALEHLTNLVRGELALARAEVEEKVRQAVRGVLLLAVAIILALVVLGLGAAAGVLALVQAGFTPLAATLICTAIAAVLALIAGWIGYRSLTPSGLAPDRTVRSLQRDAHTFKEIIRHEHVH